MREILGDFQGDISEKYVRFLCEFPKHFCLKDR